MFTNYTGAVELNELCSEKVNRWERTSQGHTLREVREIGRQRAPLWSVRRQLSFSRLEALGEDVVWWDDGPERADRRLKLFAKHLSARHEVCCAPLPSLP